MFRRLIAFVLCALVVGTTRAEVATTNAVTNAVVSVEAFSHPPATVDASAYFPDNPPFEDIYAESAEVFSAPGVRVDVNTAFGFDCGLMENGVVLSSTAMSDPVPVNANVGSAFAEIADGFIRYDSSWTAKKLPADARLRIRYRRAGEVVWMTLFEGAVPCSGRVAVPVEGEELDFVSEWVDSAGTVLDALSACGTYSIPLVAEAVCEGCCVDSSYAVEPAFASENETVTFCAGWQTNVPPMVARAEVTVANADGEELLLVSGSGADVQKRVWTSSADAFGAYNFTHRIFDADGGLISEMAKTLLWVDAERHAGRLAGDETWSASRVHLVVGDVIVPAGVTLAIEPSAIVKFMPGTRLVAESGATGICAGAIFTHINDDTVGGDTFFDGATTSPVDGAYALTGNWMDDATTQYRYSVPIEVGGTLTGEIRWPGHRTYKIKSNVTLASGATLNIEPGAIVKFGSGLSLTVNSGATLNASGTRALPIVFTSIKDDEYGGDTNGDGGKTTAEPGDWRYIYVNGTATLTHCRLAYGAPANETGIVATSGSGSLLMDACIVAHPKYDGVWNWGGRVMVRNSIFYDCGNAIAPYRGESTCANCVFAECNSGFMDWSHWNGGTFVNCIFYRCGRSWCDTNSSVEFQTHSTVRNCCFYNLVGIGKQSCDKDGIDGCFYGDPLFLEPDHGDYRIAAGSPCADAGDDAIAPETDYYGQPRVGRADVGICESQPRSTPSEVDLRVRDVVVRGEGIVGSVLEVEWTVENLGSVAAVDPRRDLVDLVDANGAVHRLGEYLEVKSVPAGGTAVFRASFALPAVATGEARVRVAVNAYRDIFEGSLTENNQAISDAGIVIRLPSFAAAAPMDVSVPAGGSTAFVIPRGELVSAVRVFAGAGAVSALGGVGYTPGGLHYDVSGVQLQDGSLLLVVPADAADDLTVALSNGGSAAIDVRVEASSSDLISEERETRPEAGSGKGEIVASLAVPTTTRQGRIYVGAVSYENVGIGDALAPYLHLSAAGVQFRLLGDEAWSQDDLFLVGVADSDPAGVVRAGEKFTLQFEFRAQTSSDIVLRTASDTSSAWDDSMKEISQAATVVNRRGRSVALYSELLRIADELEDADNHRAVSGTLADSVTGLPLSGAHVVALDQTGQVVSQDAVDTQGVFSLEGLVSGASLVLRVVGGGFADPLTVTVPADADLNGIRWFGVAASTLNFAFRGVDEADKGRTMQGTVTGFTADEETLLSTSNAQPVSVSIRGDSAHLYAWRLKDGWEAIGAVEQSVGGEPQTVVVDFSQGGRVAGCVKNPSGAPVENACVVLQSESCAEFSVSVLTGVDGSYSFGCLPEGAYLVCVSAEGYGMPKPVFVKLAETDRVALDDIVMVGFSNTLAVAVSGSGAARAKVVMDSGFTSAIADVPAFGVVGFGGLPAGIGRVVFLGDAGQCVQVASPIYIVSGSNELTVAISGLRYTVACRAKDSTGEVVKATWEFVNTDRDGATLMSAESYAVTSLRAGTYDVSVSAVGYKTVAFRRVVDGDVYWDVALEEDPDYLNAALAELAMVTNSLSQAQAIASSNIFGRVVGWDFDDYTGGSVTFRSEDGTVEVSTGLSAEGWFCCPSVPDVATQVWVLLTDGTLFSVSRTEAESTAWTLTVPVDDIGEVDLEVVDEDGRPQANKDVVFVYGGFSFHRNTNSKGHVSVKTTKGNSGTAKVDKDVIDIPPPLGPGSDPPEPPVPPDPPDPPEVIPHNGEEDPKPPTGGDVKIEVPKDTPVTVEERPIVQEELPELQENLVDMPIMPIGWGAYMTWDWYNRYLALLQDYQRRLDGLHKEKLDPNYASCIAKRCTYNNRVWNQYVVCRSSAQVAVADTQYELELAHMRARVLTGNVVADGCKIGLAVMGPLGSVLSMGAEMLSRIGRINRMSETETGDVDAEMFSLLTSYGQSLSGPLLEAFGPDVVNAIIRFQYQAIYKSSSLSFSERYARMTAELAGARRARSFLSSGRGGAIAGVVSSAADGTKSSAELMSLVSSITELVSHAGRMTSRAISAAAVPYKKCSSGSGASHPDPEEKKVGSVRVEQLVSDDPNEVVGPLGAGNPQTQRFVRPGEWLTYTIYFENAATASAGAQEVWVTNPLSRWLDWNTFEMRDIVYANQSDIGLYGLHSGSCEAGLNDTDYRVRSEVSVDEAVGRANWYLRIVDATSPDGWPEDPYAGFLPPNDETHRGEGHLTYRIKVRDDAPMGVVITNSASIVFDYNDPIETDPAWWNTVGIPGVAFEKEALEVEEGKSFELTVSGGNADKAASVQVYLAYQTAAATDLDLAKGSVDGVTPKGGLKFPLTLSWKAGDTEPKTISIPVKTDKTVEDDETLVFQLAAAQGQELGETTTCKVTIRDANVAADYAAKQAKETVKTKKGVETNALAVACCAADGSGDVCGYTTGQGKYSNGSKVSLKATARPGWEFTGWGEVVRGGRGATALPDGAVVTNVVSDKASWNVTLTNDAEIVALFGRIPYVAGLAAPANGGKVTGSGYCAAGKKVTLKATANKNFAFVGWYAGEIGATGGRALPTGEAVATVPTLVFDRSAKPAKSDAKQTVITDVSESVTYYAVFKSDPEVFVTASCDDEKGAELTGKGAGKFVAGTVTGMGKYAAGKTKISLKATANKGYVFAGWWPGESGALGERPLPDGEPLSRAASYTLSKMPENDVELTAAFITAATDKANISAEVNGMAFPIRSGEGAASPLETNVWAGVYLEWPVAASALSETTVKVTGLPNGLKFTAAKPVTTTTTTGSGRTKVTTVVTNVPANTIYGAPSAASKSTTDRKTGRTTVTPSAVQVTVTTAGKSSQTYRIDTTVDPLPDWAVGTFTGPSYGGEATNGAVAVTIAASGKISAKQPVDGKAVSFAANYFDWYDADADAFWATLTAKSGTTVLTNEMAVSGQAGRVTLPAVGGGTPTLPDGGVVINGVIEAERFDAWQYNWKAEPWKTLGKSFDKKTVTYAILSDGSCSSSDEDVASPLGETAIGKVTLKFAASGAVTVSGEFVQFGQDGLPVYKNKKLQTVKATGSATMVPVADEAGETRYNVFIYLAPKGLPAHARCVEVE